MTCWPILSVILYEGIVIVNAGKLNGTPVQVCTIDLLLLLFLEQFEDYYLIKVSVPRAHSHVLAAPGQ